METYIEHIPNEVAMLEFGKRVAHASQCQTNFDKYKSDPKIIFLYGELGAGKTTLARGFLLGLGYEGRVKSPTYTLVEPYELAACTVFHFDLYRLRHPQELEAIGIQDYFIPDAICLIEWPEQGKSVLPTPDLCCYINTLQDAGREIKLVSQSVHGETILHRLQHEK